MSQRIAFFDLDGTFFRWQLYHELAFELKDRGIFSRETALQLDEALIAWQSKQKPWREYELKVIEALEPSIELLETNLFEEAARSVVLRSGHKIYHYSKKLLDELRQKDYFTLAISGSQQEVAEIFAKKYGFDACIGALYERIDGRFTGGVTRRVPGRKHEIITEFLKENPSITLEGSIAIGDSGGDISMLKMAERPIAFNPSPELFEEALRHKWEIVIERKNIAYTLEEGENGSRILAKTDTL